MALQLISLHHRYPGRSTPALDGVSLRVEPGDCYGFIGHNGAGKTTAMRLALGLTPLQRGAVRVDGFDAGRYPREARARMGGLIETPGFHAALSGRANLELRARAGGAVRRDARTDAERVLERVGLTADGGRAVGGYSQGMRQRLGIAQALLGAPRVVLLDEPTNGLDPGGIAEMRRLFGSLARDDGVAVLLSSHQLHELEGLCNRVAVLRKGQLVVESDTAALLRGASSAYRVRAEDAADTGAQLAELGLAAEPAGDELLVDLQGRAPGQVLRELVGAGREITTFAAKVPTLEEIVLACEASPADDAADDAPAPAQPPAERLAPGRPLLRAARYELRRVYARPAAPLLLLLPVLVALAAQVVRWRAVAAEQRAVEAGELFGTTAVTAFEGVGLALQAGLPLLALVTAGLASQALSGELARRTLRNLLLRPIRRAQVVLGKALAHLVATAAGYVVLLAGGILGAGQLFDFGDVEEILPNGLAYTHIEAAELWPELWAVLPVCFVPLLACTALGLAAGALLRSPAGSLALALGGLLAIDLGRGFARPFGLEGAMLTAQLPSHLGDRSAVGGYVDFCRGVSNALEPASQSPAVVSLLWLLPALVLSVFVLSRRSVA
ncbi:MAG: ABC transporter ATP-binding protein [Planctomycetota bacterium]